MMNILNGGAHADSSVDVQEFMVMPAGAPSFREALRAGAEIFHALRGHPEGPGALDRRRRRGRLRAEPQGQPRGARRRAGGHRQGRLQGRHGRVHRARRRVERAVERTAKYVFKKSGEPTRTPAADGRDVQDWVRQYPIVSIEDGHAENDWHGWKVADRRRSDGQVQLVGDDLFVTNPAILKKGIDEGIGNAILVKLNQIGTVTETLDCVAMAQRAGYATIISHRSGETEDSTIADLAVATSAGQIKTGSASRSDRVAKYNQLLRIEEELGSAAKYAGKAAIKNLK